MKISPVVATLKSTDDEEILFHFSEKWNMMKKKREVKMKKNLFDIIMITSAQGPDRADVLRK
jgi:hypothetical protein